jgi:PAS domain S-box-containing protein
MEQGDGARFAMLYDRAPCGLLSADTGGRVIAVNDTLCRWLGYTREELTGGRRLNDLLTMGGRLFYQTHLQPLLQMQGSVAEVQLELRHQAGHTLPVLTSILRTRPPNSERRDDFAFMVSADRKKYEQELLKARRDAESALAERHQALESLRATEAQLRALNQEITAASRRKDEFLGILGHELRNPLSALSSGLELMRLKSSPDPMVARAIQVFERQIGYIEHLASDLMDAASIGQGKLRLDRAPVKVSTIVERARELAEARFAASGQRLLTVPGADSTIEADLVRLVQVVGNLLNNASKYSGPGATTWLEYGRDGGTALIRVRDNGPGIDPSHLAHIFDMFTQLDSTSGRAQGGIGIGLALVKGLVELHGGKVVAESDGLGHGCSFTVRLPVIE